jgi:hypothetical protein
MVVVITDGGFGVACVAHSTAHAKGFLDMPVRQLREAI